LLIFFFSSRRRHTRFSRDWSSDVCSSDLNYKNVFDTISGFMRPKLSDGSFKKEFDPMDTHGQGFIEGNSWNYSLYVPHQPDTMIAMMGGKDAFVNRLDSLFTMELPDKYFANTEDISRE